MGWWGFVFSVMLCCFIVLFFLAMQMGTNGFVLLVSSFGSFYIF